MQCFELLTMCYALLRILLGSIDTRIGKKAEWIHVIYQKENEETIYARCLVPTLSWREHCAWYPAEVLSAFVFDVRE